MLKNKYFGDRAFYRLALSVALPIMVQNGITNFVGMLDNVMVGRVGTTEMTGVSIANTLIFIYSLAIFGAVSGAGIFGAQFYGKGDEQGVRYAFRFKLLVGTLLSALAVLVLLLFGKSLIRLYLRGKGDAGSIEGSLYYGYRYVRIMLLGFPAFMLVQCYAGTLRECGKTVLPMNAGIIAVCVNCLLNWLLIFGKLGLPRLGTDGAAIATVISRYVEAGIVMLRTHLRPNSAPVFRGACRSLRIPAALAGRITRKSIPMLLNETLWALGQALLLQCYSVRAYEVVSAVNISSTLSNLFQISFMALGNAAGILVGQRLGAGESEQAKDTARKLTVFSVLLCAAFGAGMAAISGVFPRLYNTTAGIRSLATAFILIHAALMPAYSYTCSCYFTIRSGGRTVYTFLFDSVFTIGVVAPLAYCLSRFTRLPIVWLFLCCQGTELIKCAVGTVLVRSGVWVQNIVKDELTNEA